MSCAKMAEPIEMLFGMLSRVDPRNHVLDGVQITHGKGQFWGEGHAPTCLPSDDTLTWAARTAELIEMPFGLWAQVGSRNHVLNGSPDPYVKVQFLGKGHVWAPAGMLNNTLPWAVQYGWITWDAVGVVGSGELKEQCIRWGDRCPMQRSSF